MISPHEIPIGKIFWINADIDGCGKRWQRARLQRGVDDEGAIMIRYLDSEGGFEDYWNDGESEDAADLSLTDPNQDNAEEVDRLVTCLSVADQTIMELTKERDGWRKMAREYEARLSAEGLL